MRSVLYPLLICFALSGCATATRTHSDPARATGLPRVSLAANLGIENEGDLSKLYDSLSSAGLQCGLRAMSLNTEQIVVEREEFCRAKLLATRIIIRDRLTVRIYPSSDFGKSPSNSLLEVWEKGQKVREIGRAHV